MACSYPPGHQVHLRILHRLNNRARFPPSSKWKLFTVISEQMISCSNQHGRHLYCQTTAQRSKKAGGKLKFARSVSQAQSVTSTTTGGAHERGSQQICGRFYCPVMQVTISNHIYWLKTRRTAYRQGLKFLAPGSLCRRTRCSK